MPNDIRLSTSFRTNRKRRRLRRALGSSGVEALIDLWLYCGDQRPTGDLSGMSNEDIADEAFWDGDPDQLVDALASIGFLDGEPGAWKLHDWSETQPWVSSSPARQRGARKAAHERWADKGMCKGGTEFCDERCIRVDAERMRTHANASKTKKRASKRDKRHANERVFTTKKAPKKKVKTETESNDSDVLCGTHAERMRTHAESNAPIPTPTPNPNPTPNPSLAHANACDGAGLAGEIENTGTAIETHSEPPPIAEPDPIAETPQAPTEPPQCGDNRPLESLDDHEPLRGAQVERYVLAAKLGGPVGAGGAAMPRLCALLPIHAWELRTAIATARGNTIKRSADGYLAMVIRGYRERGETAPPKAIEKGGKRTGTPKPNRPPTLNETRERNASLWRSALAARGYSEDEEWVQRQCKNEPDEQTLAQLDEGNGCWDAFRIAAERDKKEARAYMDEFFANVSKKFNMHTEH